MRVDGLVALSHRRLPTMSSLRKLRFPLALLSLVSTATLVGVTYVHYRQSKDRQEMYEGVKRDLERQQLRKKSGT